MKKIPSDTSIRRWFNQVGFYKLTRCKEHAEDWIYIIDNSIRSENRKVCLILGVRAAQLQQGQALSFEVLEPLALHVINANNELEKILSDTIEKTGAPMQICSDLGSDIMPSIKKVMKNYPTIKHTPDIMHHVGNMLKRKLDKDPRWNNFVVETNKSNNTLKQSALGFMCPPNFRGKSRFLNCSSVVNWASCSIRVLQNMKQTDANFKEMYRKLGWLITHKNDIVLFEELFHLANISKEVIRKLHIQKNTLKIAQEILEKAVVTQEGREFAEEIISFIKKQSMQVDDNMIMLGVSEIIESALGKLKIVDPELGKSGFTGSVIGLAACFGNSDFQSVQAAFTTHTYKDVSDWIEKNLGKTFQQKRKELFFRFSKNKKLDLNIERIQEEEKQAI